VVAGHWSVGIARAAGPAELAKAVNHAIQFSARVLVEKAVDDRLEIQCAVLGNHALVVSECEELTQSAGIVSFEDKYLRRPGAAEADLAPSQIPARISTDLAHGHAGPGGFQVLDARHRLGGHPGRPADDAAIRE
jgi:D-alanine-D-alanine ligase